MRKGHDRPTGPDRAARGIDHTSGNTERGSGQVHIRPGTEGEEGADPAGEKQWDKQTDAEPPESVNLPREKAEREKRR